MKRSIALLIICMLTIISVRADEHIDYDDSNSINENLADADFSKISDWSKIDPTKIPVNKYNDPNINWEQVDQSKIPAANIANIPKDKVDVTKVQDKAKLTADQLAHSNNLEKSGDLSSLDSKNLNSALEQLHPGIPTFSTGFVTGITYQNGKLSFEGENPQLDMASFGQENTNVQLILAVQDKDDQKGFTIIVGGTIQTILSDNAGGISGISQTRDEGGNLHTQITIPDGSTFELNHGRIIATRDQSDLAGRINYELGPDTSITYRDITALSLSNGASRANPAIRLTAKGMDSFSKHVLFEMGGSYIFPLEGEFTSIRIESDPNSANLQGAVVLGRGNVNNEVGYINNDGMIALAVGDIADSEKTNNLIAAMLSNEEIQELMNTLPAQRSSEQVQHAFEGVIYGEDYREGEQEQSYIYSREIQGRESTNKDGSDYDAYLASQSENSATAGIDLKDLNIRIGSRPQVTSLIGNTLFDPLFLPGDDVAFQYTTGLNNMNFLVLVKQLEEGGTFRGELPQLNDWKPSDWSAIIDIGDSWNFGGTVVDLSYSSADPSLLVKYYGFEFKFGD